MKKIQWVMRKEFKDKKIDIDKLKKQLWIYSSLSTTKLVKFISFGSTMRIIKLFSRIIPSYKFPKIISTTWTNMEKENISIDQVYNTKQMTSRREWITLNHCLKRLESQINLIKMDKIIPIKKINPLL